MAENKEELKMFLLLRVKEESEKVGLKLNIQKENKEKKKKHTEIMASDPITLWQICEEKVEAVADVIFLGFKVPVDGDCSHEIKRCLLLGRKAMTKLDSILKGRNITLLTKVLIVKVKTMFFPIVVYRWESWTIKKAEHWRPDAYKLWCWRRFLRVP